MKSRQAEVALAQDSRQPLTSAMPQEVLLLLKEKTSSKTRIRKRDRKEKKEAGARSRLNQSMLQPGLVLDPREADQQPHSVSEVKTGIWAFGLL